MNLAQKQIGRVGDWLHHYFLWLLGGSYLAASVAPASGNWLRSWSLGRVRVLGESSSLSLPMLLLALLLFNAGLGVRWGQLLLAFQKPVVLLVGIVTNILYPLCLIALVMLGLKLWHNSDEAQTLLVGLAVIAAMPVAGSSTGWAQNASGNMALSLGMVLLSTMCSPFTTPVALRSIGAVLPGDYGEEMRRLAEGGTTGLLILCVVIPSLLGICAGWLLGSCRTRAVRPGIRIINSAVLLLLCYANASVCLPHVFAEPDWDFLLLVVCVVTGLSFAGFGAGALVGRVMGASQPERTSLMFGLGMTNNGTGLVMATASFAGRPMVLLPILGFNLVQHLVAGFVSARLKPGRREPEAC